MIRRETRPMTSGERAQAEKCLSRLPAVYELKTPVQLAGGILLLLLFGLAGFLLGTCAATMIFILSKILPALEGLTRPPVVRGFLTGGVLLGAAGIPLVLMVLGRKASGARRGRLQNDLEEGRVDILRVFTAAAVRRELDGEEAFYFVDAGDGKMLFLCGTYLQDPVRAGTFPNTEFELVRGIHSGVIFELHCLGRPFRAREVLFELDPEAGGFPADGELFEGRLETLEQDLKKG